MPRLDYTMADFYAEMRRRGMYKESGSLAASRTRRGPSGRKSAPAPQPVENLWIFRATGRGARVVRIDIGRDVDLVFFRFVGETRNRKVTARRFLTDFVRPGAV